ncbi:MAG: thioredoxin family protein [Ferruginibacter sp.]
MKKIIAALTLLLVIHAASAQTKLLYDPAEDAQKEIDYAVMVAKSKNKNVLIQAGGNWCKWCIEFDRFSKADSGVKAIIEKNYVVYHLNWSKENENKKVFAKYGFPQRFGFPVFIILNSKGERIHTQNSEYLEDGKKSYDVQRVKAFLEMWTPHVLEASSYGM